MNYLPSKKFILITSSIFLAGAMVFFASRSFGNAEKTPTKNSIVGTAEQPGDTQTNDRKPKQSAELDISTIAPIKTILENFTDYFNSQTANTDTATLDFGDTTKELLIKESAAEVKRLAAKKNPYSEGAINVSGEVSLKDYFNAVAETTEKYFPGKPTDKNYESEITILYQVASSISSTSTEPSVGQIEQLKESLERLAPHRDKYVIAAEDLKKLTVPPETRVIHAGLVNSLANSALAIEEIMAFDRDPIIGIVGMKMYEENIKTSRELFADIKKLLQKNNLAFEKTEPGYEFIKTYVNSTKQ
jgi:hypothetical protein